MSDPPSATNPGPAEATPDVAPTAPGNDPNLPPVVRYPPFPPVPAGVTIIPFKDFKETGIQIFSSGDQEIDGLGIPTVALRSYHKTDKRKTNAKTTPDAEIKREQHEAKNKGKGKQPQSEKKMTPLERAQEQKRQRFLLFSRKEWYEQWAEGEDLRGGRTYDPNSTSIDRIHIAAHEFRTGRIWPPGYMKITYLWNQFRLFAGLLGSPPIWNRTDRPQQNESEDEYDDETDSEVEAAKAKKAAALAAKKLKDSDDSDADSIIYSDEEEDEPPIRRVKTEKDAEEPVAKPKRIPTRTPYALFNAKPIPVGTDEEVTKLLNLATARRETRLLRFIADPEHATRVFLSWYLRYESLVWSPTHLVSFPHLVSFFLRFLVRVRALPESERSLRKAIEVANQGIAELGRTGKLCRELPDKFGIGARAIWGTRFEEPRWIFGDTEIDANSPVQESKGEGESEADALKRFEEELKAANVELLPADPVNLGVPAPDLDEIEEEDQLEATSTPAEIDDITSAADDTEHLVPVADFDLPGLEESTAKIEEIVEPEGEAESPQPVDEGLVDMANAANSSPDDANTEADKITSNESADVAVSHAEPPSATVEEEDPETLDWSKPNGRASPSEVKAAKDAWQPSGAQPLMEILGMTTFPLKYDAGGRGGPNVLGVVERSMRRVKAVIKPGTPDRERKWRGIEDDLVRRLSRVVLEPWLDWDDGGTAPDYRTPRVQGDTFPKVGPNGEVEALTGSAARFAHDPEKDDITLLMEPHVADLVMKGMGMAGTWVQLIPARDDSLRTQGDRGRGRGRGRGYSNPGSRPPKEFTFWYVEQIHLAVPSFWTVGEEEKPLTREDLDEAIELDLE